MKSHLGRKVFKKNRKLLIVFVLLLFISIGYALLSQNLNINGYSKVHNSTWYIHFDNIDVKSGSVSIGSGDTAATINPNDDTEVSYTVTLNKPGDYYEFTVDAVNDGSIDGMVDLTSSKIKIGDNDYVDITDEYLPKYLKYKVSYASGGPILKNHILKAGESETYKVRIEYSRDINKTDLPSEDKTITINIDSDYIQANDSAVEVPPYLECTYDGNMVQGAEYTNGQYTYRYMQDHDGSTWNNISNDGWGVILTNKESTDPVNTKFCSSINGKPIVSMKSMFYNSKASSIDTSSF